MQDEGHGFGLEAGDIEWFQRAVGGRGPGGLRTDPAGQPGLREPDLASLPAAIVTSPASTIHSATRARPTPTELPGGQASPVRRRREAGLVHNFLLWDTISPACAAAGDRVADDLAAVLRPA